MSVTADPIPHGLQGFRKPWNCGCDVCKAANRKYNRDKQAEYRSRPKSDELASKRAARKTIPPIGTAGHRAAAARRSESSDSVRRVGEMESAVIEECSEIDPKPKATLVIAAKNLARSVDSLAGNAKVIPLYNSTLKQLMATMAELRGDKTDKRATGRRKSGGRLATVGNLTKVKRAQ